MLHQQIHALCLARFLVVDTFFPFAGILSNSEKVRYTMRKKMNFFKQGSELIFNTGLLFIYPN